MSRGLETQHMLLSSSDELSMTLSEGESMGGHIENNCKISAVSVFTLIGMIKVSIIGKAVKSPRPLRMASLDPYLGTHGAHLRSPVGSCLHQITCTRVQPLLKHDAWIR